VQDELGVGALAPWRRFHVRTTFLFGALAILLLGAMSLVSYRRSRETEFAALAARLRSLAVAMAEGIDPRTIDAALAEAHNGSPSHRQLVDFFARVAEDEDDVSSIYIVVPAENGWVRFAADWVRTGTPARVGQRYDARRMPEMGEAFGGPCVEHEVKTDEWGPSLSGYAPIHDRRGRAVAVIGIDVTADRIARIDESALVATAIVWGAALFVLIATGLVLGRNVRRPIARIVEATSALAERDFMVRVGLERSDELGILARHFDRMAADLEERERIRAIFGRYVSEDVARRVLARPGADRLGGEERETTMLFVDVQRFSTMSERLPPRDLVVLLERYVSAITELVETHGGCVIEMLGTSILAVFGAPNELEEHPACAVRCAIAIEARIAALGEEWAEPLRALGIDRLRARIGIHTGCVVAGNTGSETRMKYAVIGDAVNLAARIERLNDRLGTTMLISKDVYRRLPPELASIAHERGEHAVKGRRPVNVYALGDQRDDSR
jgi:adenylate cyclase